MSMCKVLCVTNRHLVSGDFRKQMEKIAASGVDGIILREKDLDIGAYQELAEQVQKICGPLILHTYPEAVKKTGIRRIHLSYAGFCALGKADRSRFELVGVSVHSAAEAVEVQRRGASYLTAGHIFATDCKKGIPPRGTGFLKEICQAVELPVCAIGGIGPENAGLCVQAGAEGICLMSSLMQAEDPEELVRQIRRNLPG